MNRKFRSIAAVLGIWCAVLLVACYEDNISSPEGRLPRIGSLAALAQDPQKRTPQPPTIPPRKLKLRQGNAFACGIVEYTGETNGRRHRSDEIMLTRVGRPAFQRTRPSDSTGVGHVHFIQWEAGTSNRMFEASCVVPRAEEAAQFAIKELRKLARVKGLNYHRIVASAAPSAPGSAGGDESTAIVPWESTSPGESGPYADELEVITADGFVDDNGLAVSAINFQQQGDPNCWMNWGTGNIDCEGDVDCWSTGNDTFACDNGCMAYYDWEWDDLDWSCPPPPNPECDPNADECCVFLGGTWVIDYDDCDECEPEDNCCTYDESAETWVIDYDECDECDSSDACCVYEDPPGEWVWDTGECPGGGGSPCPYGYVLNQSTEQCEIECPFGYVPNPNNPDECIPGSPPPPPEPPQPYIDVTCNNSSVVRGSGIQCPLTASGSMTNIRWTFTPTGTMPVTLQPVNFHEDGPANTSTWNGTMVQEGKIKVVAFVGGADRSDSVIIGIVARASSSISDAVAVAIATVDTLRRDTVTLGEHLGVTTLRYDSLHVETSTDTTHGTGPNLGYSMRNRMNLVINPLIRVNTGQMASNTNLYLRHDPINNPPSGSCTTTFVASTGGLEFQVRAHEGVGSSPAANSHTGWSRQWVTANQDSLRRGAERLVLPRETDLSPLNKFRFYSGILPATWEATGRFAIDGTTPMFLTCNLVGVTFPPAPPPG